MKLFGLKSCDTCRKAMKALPDAEFVDVRTDGVPDDVLRAALETFGAALVNTRSTTWRELDDAARAQDPMEQLKAHPTLMKRPLIVTGDAMHLGWTAKTQGALGV